MAEPDSSLDQLSAAAVRYRIVVGPLARRVRFAKT
jgi:hypothetical protein